MEELLAKRSGVEIKYRRIIETSYVKSLDYLLYKNRIKIYIYNLRKKHLRKKHPGNAHFLNGNWKATGKSDQSK